MYQSPTKAGQISASPKVRSVRTKVRHEAKQGLQLKCVSAAGAIVQQVTLSYSQPRLDPQHSYSTPIHARNDAEYSIRN